MDTTKAKRALADLGFSELESEVYLYLLQSEPTTGYKIAQGLGRLAPNVYQTIDSLSVKGAVLVEQGSSRVCRAVPVEELLAAAQARFERTRETVRSTIGGISENTRDDRIYKLVTVDSVLERAQAMIRAAERMVLVDCFPSLTPLLLSELDAAHARGIQVVLKAYDDVGEDQILVVHNPRPNAVLSRFPPLLTLAVDGEQLLLAQFDAEMRSISHGLWTGNAFLSYLFHTSLATEMQFCLLLGLLAGIPAVRNNPDLNEALGDFWDGIRPIAHREMRLLFKQLRESFWDVPGENSLQDPGNDDLTP